MNEEEKKAIKVLKINPEIIADLDKELLYKMFEFEGQSIKELKKWAYKIVLNLITKLQKENEEKDKQIDLMANSILAREIGKNSCQFNKTCTKFEKGRDIHCKHCIKQYFERKAEDEK